MKISIIAFCLLVFIVGCGDSNTDERLSKLEKSLSHIEKMMEKQEKEAAMSQEQWKKDLKADEFVRKQLDAPSNPPSMNPF